ncbi:MAG TPA: hypothetical protein RMH99_09170 [Sandaracinaceae bacterium LLY-WYZ-13_1]|nr:hypothetical protein [Sandaracinaceae bacterium LLY-WYZ-13_1]
MSASARSWVARRLTPARRAWLARPRSHAVLVLVSVLLCAPALGVGWQLDDHVHHLLVQGGREARIMWRDPPHPLDLFRFVDGDRADWRWGLSTGAAPWYMHPEVRLAFWRPVAAATHVLDYTLLEEAPWAMHLHSLLWLLALGLAVARLVRRLEAGWVAGLTVLFYVLDPGHGMPAGWLANRSILMAGAFGALALDAHLRWRRGTLRTPIGSLLWMALALLAGESALGWVAFFVAFAGVLDPAGPKRGLLALAPLGALVVSWRFAYRALGYGAAHSAIYVDPVREPLEFALALAQRMPQLLAGQLGGPPAGVLALAPSLAPAAIGAALVVVAVALVALVPHLRRDRPARFWALGALLATVPVCATHPHPRLMLVAGLGVAGVLARFVASVVHGPAGESGSTDRAATSAVAEDASSRADAPAEAASRPVDAVGGPAPVGAGPRPVDASGAGSGRVPSRFERGLAAVWLVLLVVVAPLRMPFEAWSVTLLGGPARRAVDGVPAEAVGRTLVVLAVPDPMFMCGQTPLALASLERPAPARFRCVAPVEGHAELVREDARTLVVRVPDGLMDAFFVPLLRDRDARFAPGWRLALSDVRFTIAGRGPDDRPTALRLRFDTPLEDPARLFVAWSPAARRFVPVELPAIGETIRIEGEPLAELLIDPP